VEKREKHGTAIKNKQKEKNNKNIFRRDKKNNKKSTKCGN
jgi:hypothetical protein